MSQQALIERVEALIEEVVSIRVEIWDREWAGGRHREAPPKPEREKQKPRRDGGV